MAKSIKKRISPPKKPPVKPTERGPIAPHKLLLLITVVPRKKAEYFVDLIGAFECNMQLEASAFGTSGVFGLGYDLEKQAIFSVVRQDVLPKLLATLENKFATVRGAKGLAFTVPLTSMVGVSAYQFLSNKQ